MTFKSYKKIHRLGAEENDGILVGTCYIQEKIDGANTSIWLSDGQIKCASRSQPVESGFNGFVDYVKSQEGFVNFFNDHPDWRLYGEWLVRHTIAYDETVYRQWYLFDIMDSKDNFIPLQEVLAVAEKYGFKTATLFCTIEHPTPEQIQEYVGKTMLGKKGEGVVIKNFEFRNKFGDLEYAKVVTQEFKEDNAVVFGGNNRYSDTYWEMYVVQKYMTLPRIEKIMNKIQPQIEKKLGMSETARIINTAYHDMITEEIWEIQGKVPTLDFKQLKRLATRKAARIYHDILGNNVSVAFRNNNE